MAETDQAVPNAVEELENHETVPEIKAVETLAVPVPKNGTNDVNGNQTKEIASQKMEEVPNKAEPEIKGKCPICKEGNVQTSYTLPGILWFAICLPVGWICFLNKKKKKCDQCDYEDYPDCCFGA